MVPILIAQPRLTSKLVKFLPVKREERKARWLGLTSFLSRPVFISLICMLLNPVEIEGERMKERERERERERRREREN